MIRDERPSKRQGKSSGFLYIIPLAMLLMSCFSGPSIFPANNSKVSTPPSQAPQVFDFFPSSATEGVLVTITGVNFKGVVNNATPEVRFNGTKATIAPGFSSNSIVATVPSGVTSGPITVTVSSLTGASNRDFVVPSLIGSWKQVSHELANCPNASDNLVVTCTSCQTMTFSATLLTITEPGVPTMEIPYVQSGNLITLTLPTGSVRTDVFSIADKTLTIRYNAAFGCKGTETLTRI